MGEKITIYSAAEQEVEAELNDLESNQEIKKLENSQIIIETLKEVLKDGEILGEGKTAEVRCFDIKECKSCVKIIKHKELAINDSLVEMKFLDDGVKLGARVPKPFCAVMTESGNDYLIMETIKGHSLKDHLEKGILLPEAFDLDIFFENLKLELERLHKKGRIYHRDLHEGNIMVSPDGLPTLIDFGDAKKNFLSEEDPYQESSLDGGAFYLPDDIDKFKEIKNEFTKYINTLKQEKGGV